MFTLDYITQVGIGNRYRHLFVEAYRNYICKQCGAFDVQVIKKETTISDNIYFIAIDVVRLFALDFWILKSETK